MNKALSGKLSILDVDYCLLCYPSSLSTDNKQVCQLRVLAETHSPSYLASAETVHDLLLPAETVVLGK